MLPIKSASDGFGWEVVWYFIREFVDQSDIWNCSDKKWCCVSLSQQFIYRTLCHSKLLVCIVRLCICPYLLLDIDNRYFLVGLSGQILTSGTWSTQRHRCRVKWAIQAPWSHPISTLLNPKCSFLIVRTDFFLIFIEYRRRNLSFVQRPPLQSLVPYAKFGYTKSCGPIGLVIVTFGFNCSFERYQVCEFCFYRVEYFRLEVLNSLLIATIPRGKQTEIITKCISMVSFITYTSNRQDPELL